MNLGDKLRIGKEEIVISRITKTAVYVDSDLFPTRLQIDVLHSLIDSGDITLIPRPFTDYSKLL
jgi:hypothetical protein